MTGATAGKKTSAGNKRRKAMLDAAWSLFLERGYAAVSLDDIIRESGGSKASLYKFFGSKEGILTAVVDALANRMLADIDLMQPSGASPRAALRRLARHVCRLALSRMAINQYRLAVANAVAFPHVAKRWFRSGPERVMAGIAKYLGRESRAGRLRIRNPPRAARLFMGMILFHENLRLSIGGRPRSQKELEPAVNEAVEIFLRAYGA